MQSSVGSNPTPSSDTQNRSRTDTPLAKDFESSVSTNSTIWAGVNDLSVDLFGGEIKNTQDYLHLADIKLTNNHQETTDN